MKYSVQVTITAEVTYEVEVEASSEGNAEDEACSLWRSKLPEDFQVEKGYITVWDSEVEQLTFECQECGQEIFAGNAGFDDECCPPCFQNMEATNA